MQPVFIHQVIFRERLRQHTAAVGEDIFSGLLLELSDGVDDIFADEDRVSPG